MKLGENCGRCARDVGGNVFAMQINAGRSDETVMAGWSRQDRMNGRERTVQGAETQALFAEIVLRGLVL